MFRFWFWVAFLTLHVPHYSEKHERLWHWKRGILSKLCRLPPSFMLESKRQSKKTYCRGKKKSQNQFNVTDSSIRMCYANEIFHFEAYGIEIGESSKHGTMLFCLFVLIQVQPRRGERWGWSLKVNPCNAGADIMSLQLFKTCWAWDLEVCWSWIVCPSHHKVWLSTY